MSGGNCEKCATSFQGNPIPQEYLYMYHGETHYSRIIGIEIRGAYDGVLIWRCPDCGFMWPRFADGKLHNKAVEIIAEQERMKDEREDELNSWAPEVPF